MSETTFEAGVVRLPAGDGNGTICISLSRIARMEARMEELAFVDRFKAPELARAMNQGYLDVANELLVVNRHLRKAQERVALREATILLDELPEIMRQRGIPQANETLRKAVFAQDHERQTLQDVATQLEAIQQVLKIKQAGFKNAFDAVKKVLGGGGPPAADRDVSHGVRQDSGNERLPPTAYRMNGLNCPVCDLPQYMTPSGACCAQGHGGLDGVRGAQDGSEG